MGLKTDMQDLLKSLMNSFIYYIPRSLFPNVKPEHLEQLEKLVYHKRLFYTDAKGKDTLLKKTSEHFQIIDKPKVLKSNIFELLDLKSRLDKDAFHYLIDDYLSNLDKLIRITDCIKNEAKTDTQNYEPEIQIYLDIQYKQFYDHKEELIKHFGKWKARVELNRIFNTVGRKVTPSTLSIPPIVIPEVQPKTNKTTTLPIEKKKTTFPSDDEIDIFLLETVFRVDFLEINDKKP